MKERKVYKVIEDSSWYIVIPENNKKTEHYTFSTKELADDFCKAKNSEYYISDYTDKEIQEFLSSIDWSGLLKEVKSKLNVNIVPEQMTTASWNDYGNVNFFIRFYKEFCEENEILNMLFRTCFLKGKSDDCVDVNRKTGDLFFKIYLFFETENYDLATTIIPFSVATYSNTTKKWTFEYTKDIFKY